MASRHAPQLRSAGRSGQALLSAADAVASVTVRSARGMGARSKPPADDQQQHWQYDAERDEPDPAHPVEVPLEPGARFERGDALFEFRRQTVAHSGTPHAEFNGRSPPAGA